MAGNSRYRHTEKHSVKFGIFMAPFHRAGENPTLCFERDLELIEWLDRTGYDEVFIGEHHSSGWEIISSPDIFIAAAAGRTRRIMLGSGVVSVPYHNPFNIANRYALLDHLTRGRVMLGCGPGALAADAHMQGIDSTTQRKRMVEGVSAILRLFNEQGKISIDGSYFKLVDAHLQVKPFQQPHMPVFVASTISPSGMVAAGQLGCGVLSVASYAPGGLDDLMKRWAMAEESAAENGKTVDRKNWRVLLSWHIAETREKARAEAREGLMRHHNQYVVGTLQRPDAKPFKDPDEAVDKAAFSDGASATIGTPDDLVARIKSVLEISGGFGTLVGFVHDWANPENTMRSWDMVARYVVPEINGYLTGLRQSQDFVATNRGVFDRAKEAIMAKITENEAAVAALAVTRGSRLGDVASASNVPDLEKARSQARAR